MKNLPTGVSRAPFGSQEWEQEMQRDFGIALISGTLLVFAVLVLLYRRFMSPLVNMGSLLLAPLGGMLALAIVGQPISMPVFIGVLMLFGIVAKNSICSSTLPSKKWNVVYPSSRPSWKLATSVHSQS